MPVTEHPPMTPAASPAPEDCIIFQDAGIVRGKKLIWSQGSFSIPHGSVTAIVGTNGTGKTTMISVELGLLPLTRGSVKVLGLPAGAANRYIGYVPQNYDSAGDMNITVRDSVLLGLTGTVFGWHRTTKAEKDKAFEAIDYVGLSTYTGQRLSQLSGGQRQRVAIAQALVGDPKLLLLDEPLANLDISSQSSLIELLAKLNREQHITIHVVSHDLNMLLPILTGAVYLLDGHPHYSPLDGILNSDLLTHLYGTKVEVIATPQGDMFVTHNSSLEPPSRTRHDLHTSSDAARFHTGKPCSGEKTEKDGTHD